MDLLSWQNITLRKRSWELNICNKFPIGVILRSKKNNMCSGKGEKDETENEKMFWFKFEDRVSGEGLKELDEKKWEFGSSGLKRLDPMAWKELNPEGRSWIKWLYEFSSWVSLWWSSSWGELQSEEFSPLHALVADTLLPRLVVVGVSCQWPGPSRWQMQVRQTGK